VKRREALVLGAAGVVATVSGALVALRALRADPGEELHAARFSDLAGAPRRLAEWTGLVTLCNFWATWCAPCREEIPILVSIHGEYASKGVQIVGIGLDSRANVVEFVKSLGMSYPVLLGGPDSVELLRRLGNQAGALPYSLVLDRRGGIVRTRLGEMKRPDVQELLEAGLAA
jgi:thiol-disulfide isomerase/thioredoxin